VVTVLIWDKTQAYTCIIYAHAGDTILLGGVDISNMNAHTPLLMVHVVDLHFVHLEIDIVFDDGSMAAKLDQTAKFICGLWRQQPVGLGTLRRQPPRKTPRKSHRRKVGFY